MTRKVAATDPTPHQFSRIQIELQRSSSPGYARTTCGTYTYELKAAQEALDTHVWLNIDERQEADHERSAKLAELKACRAELQSGKAELKILRECVESQGQRVIEVEAKMADK